MGFIVQRYRAAAFSLFFLAITMASADSFATTNASTIADNMAVSAGSLPGLVTAFAYILGLLFGVRGILKLKSHVEAPGESAGQTPLRTPMISFMIGGALFSLPMIFEAARGAFRSGASPGTFAGSAELVGAQAAPGGTGDDFNAILENITTSIGSLPGLVTALAYLLATGIIVMGLIKTKEHVESPEQTKIQEGVVRILVGGALFAVPTIFEAMSETIANGGIGASVAALLGAGANFFGSEYIAGAAADTCTEASGSAASMGQLICAIKAHAGAIPAFFTALAYLFGLVMGVWGILKIRDHVLNPQQTHVFEGITRLIAGGAFFALPVTVEVFKNTISGGVAFGTSITKYNHGTGTVQAAADAVIAGGTCPTGTGLGLDGLLVCFATDILGPVHIMLNFFAFIAGMIFIMIGISRLVKGAQEGARGPGGLGTIMSFMIGGALVSYNDIMRAATTTFTGQVTTQTFAEMQYTTGMSANETAAVHAVITSVVKFMIVVGLISFVRGLFIVRSVAEGNQQASMMAAVTHIIGGTLAVNLGPVLNAVQATLGTSTYGISFS